MVELRMEELVGEDRRALAERIRASGGRIRLTITQPKLYQAHSKDELAGNWLKVWYVTESVAEGAESASCEYHEGDFGGGVVQLELLSRDSDRLAEALVEHAPAFDDDDLEATGLVYDYAADWLEKRGNAKTWFPELEENYRGDLEDAEIQRLEKASMGDM